jgi:hypothetical protein
MDGYDVIGDIHGHAEKLEGLLQQMGYTPAGRGYRAPNGRQAVFLGDLIDRGPDQLRVLEIVRAMIDNGDARCIMGNHEYNAIGFVTPSRETPSEFLRPNNAKKRAQHLDFLGQIGERTEAHLAWVNWFKTLPLFLDLGCIRVVHGSWNDAAVAEIAGVYWDSSEQRMSDDFLFGSHEQDSRLMAARKLLTCGFEWDLPEGMHIYGKGGEKHKEVRIANWRHEATRLHEVALVPEGNLENVPDISIPSHVPMDPIQGSPVFLGHHWFSGFPKIETPKLAVLDYSAGKGGPLVTYRWQGEEKLSNENFVWVGKR